MLIFRTYLRAIANQKSKALVLIILYGVLLISIQRYPQNIVITNALNYQDDDVIGVANLTNYHEAIDSAVISRYSTLGRITVQSISEFEIISNDFSFNGLSIVEFDNIAEPLIQINEIWLNDLQSQRTLFLGDLIFNQSQIESTKISNRLFDAIITIPQQFKANISSFYLGLNINTDIDLIEDSKKLNLEIQSFMENVNSRYYTVFEWEVFFNENSQVLSESIDKLELQIFTVSLLIFLTLLASILFIQYSFEKANQNTYYLLNLRGLSQENISRYFIIYSTVLNLVLTSISIGIAYITTNIKLDFSLALLFVVTLSTSIFTSYFSTKQNLIKSNDIFDVDIPPSFLEIGLLILSILSFLVNVFLNLPSVAFIKFILILSTYLSVSLLFSAILFYSLKSFNRLISKFYMNKQKNTPIQSLHWLFIKLNIRLDKKQVISSIITGILVISIISHLSVVSDFHVDDTDTPYGALWAQYPEKLPDNFDIDIMGQYSVAYPTTINLQISTLQGLVFTDASLFSFHNQFAGVRIKQTPELWVREGYDLSNFISYLSFVKIGDTDVGSISFTESLQIENFFDANVMLPGQPDFILFLEESILKDYNSSIFLLFDINSETKMPDFQIAVKNQLDRDIIWVQPPFINIVDFTTQHLMNENTWLDEVFTSIFSLFIVFSLAFVETRMRFGREFEIMRLKGVTINQFRRVGLFLYLKEFPLRIIFLMLGATSVLFLINTFRLISNDVNIDLNNIMGNVFLFSIIIYLGQVSNWLLQVISKR
ncbi:MAG: hypothetical protein GPJ54_17435 [Candidatus Heimdallarchaeota archaeon]|nr:hypothetical protein [Candidatus Heimdallarchaeota archaeon]